MHASDATEFPGLAYDRRAHLMQVLIAVGEENVSAFEALYELTSRKLFAICLRICGDWQSAEDVLQDVYLTVWRSAGGFEPGQASPISWLATIARNRSIDWHRRAAKHIGAPIEEAEAIPEPSLSAHDQMLVAEDHRQLNRHLDALDERQRRAIHTAFFEGLTYAELADQQAVPLGTMKSWVRRGLLELRHGLIEEA